MNLSKLIERFQSECKQFTQRSCLQIEPPFCFTTLLLNKEITRARIGLPWVDASTIIRMEVEGGGKAYSCPNFATKRVAESLEISERTGSSPVRGRVGISPHARDSCSRSDLLGPDPRKCNEEKLLFTVLKTWQSDGCRVGLEGVFPS